MKVKLTLQTFTIRKYLKTVKSAEDALARVKELGIDGLELARVKFSPGYIHAISRICRDLDLKVVSTQMKLKEIASDLDWTIRMHNQLGCSNCVVSVISFKHLKAGEEGLKAYAEKLNGIGRRLKEEGISLLFHHHNYEFLPIGNNCGFDILKNGFNPEYVGLVLDTYWLQRSGLNPPAVIRENRGLVKGVHLRDFKLKSPISSPKITDAALGDGNLDFQEILSACSESRVEYTAIEQDTKSPFKSIALSLCHLEECNRSIS
ncbi:MAG: sugar phosphate isomerase/epimerase [Spirochaetales bacterium]|nr:sugar phosphate isomerase/epimerase [Spirochaetales bacterium]